MMNSLIYEFIGTAILLLLGDGVVANTVLKNTKSHGAGWVVITFGWGLGVFLAVVVAGPHSGAHINPAVSVGLAAAGLFPWSSVPGYIIAQMLGGFFGAGLVYFYFKPHFNITDCKDTKLGVFCTSPAIRKLPHNLFCEISGTFVLLFVILHFTEPSLCTVSEASVSVGLGSIGALPVALLVVGIGMSLGGTTGYAINPARDLGPRIVHALFPLQNKRDSDWGYSWIPVAGPIIGAIIAALIFLLLK
jgi:glycerol uptake facilitator protein